MRSPQFGLVESFDIDDEKLNMTAKEAFVLGVEWTAFRRRLQDEPGEFVVTVHAENEERLLRLSRRHGRSGIGRRLDLTWVDLVIPAQGHMN